MLRPLPGPRVWVVLLPREARLLPALVHRVDKVLTQPREEILGLGPVGPFLRGNVLASKIEISKLY